MLTVWGTAAFKGGILGRIHRGEKALLWYCDEKLYKSVHKLIVHQKEKNTIFKKFSCTITVLSSDADIKRNFESLSKMTTKIVSSRGTTSFSDHHCLCLAQRRLRGG